MGTNARAPVTEREFLSLPETVRPAELVDGEVVMAPSPSFWHQEVLTRVVVALRSWAATQTPAPSVVQAPMDVRFGPGRILQPDAMVFLSPLDRSLSGPVEQIPELCVEVLSSNLSHDRITKRYVYAEAGVREYWLIDPAGVVERCSGSGLARNESIGEQLQSTLLPGFVLDVRALLA